MCAYLSLRIGDVRSLPHNIDCCRAVFVLRRCVQRTLEITGSAVAVKQRRATRAGSARRLAAKQMLRAFC